MPKGVGGSSGTIRTRVPNSGTSRIPSDAKGKTKTSKLKTAATPRQVAAQAQSSRSHAAGKMKADLSLAASVMNNLHKEVDRVFQDAPLHGSIHANKMSPVKQELLQKTKAQREKLDNAAEALAQDVSGKKSAYTTNPVLPESYKSAPGMSWAERNDLNKLFIGTEMAGNQTRFYHATRTRNTKGKTGIFKQGLDPNFGGKGAAKATQEYQQQSKSKVHFTKSEHHAGEYQTFFETGKMPGNEELKTKKSRAEVLKLALPADVVNTSQKDPHDQLGRTTDKKIDAKYIRSSVPNPAPGKLKNWQELDQKGKAENEAILSNMKPDVRKIFDERFPVGDAGSVEQNRRDTALQLLKQGLRSKQSIIRSTGPAFD
jgi:hypothetical protein